MANSVDSDKFLDLEEIGVDLTEDSDPLACSFRKAANYLQNLVPQLDNQTLLTLYGYYKQGSEGPCNTPKPSWYDMKGKSKWEAWNKLGNMPKNEARTLYVETIKTIDPSFDEGVEKQGHGNRVSLMAKENHVPHDQKTIIDHVKDGRVEEVKTYVQENPHVIKKVINEHDELGLALIHWAADSGHDTLIEVLLEYCADINLVDCDGQTALHYAASCGHMTCVKFLLEKGARADIADNEGNLAVHVAADDEIKHLLK